MKKFILILIFGTIFSYMCWSQAALATVHSYIVDGVELNDSIKYVIFEMDTDLKIKQFLIYGKDELLIGEIDFSKSTTPQRLMSGANVVYGNVQLKYIRPVDSLIRVRTIDQCVVLMSMSREDFTFSVTTDGRGSRSIEYAKIVLR